MVVNVLSKYIPSSQISFNHFRSWHLSQMELPLSRHCSFVYNLLRALESLSTSRDIISWIYYNTNPQCFFKENQSVTSCQVSVPSALIIHQVNPFNISSFQRVNSVFLLRKRLQFSLTSLKLSNFELYCKLVFSKHHCDIRIGKLLL